MYEWLKGVLVFVWTWAKIVFGVPPLTDQEATRQFIRDYLEHAARVAAATPGKKDDQSVALAQALINDDQAWAAIYLYLCEQLKPACTSMPPATLAEEIGALPIAAGWDQETVLAIIRALVEAFTAIWTLIKA